jgi:hypothetical protein
MKGVQEDFWIWLIHWNWKEVAWRVLLTQSDFR